MPVIATSTLVKQRLRFIVEIPGVNGSPPLRARFRTCSELSFEVAPSEIRHGGSVIPYSQPAGVTYTPVTLEMGATNDGRLFLWAMQCALAGGGIGGAGDAHKRIVDIVEQDRTGLTINRWRCFNAWVTKFVAGDWDNESNDFLISSVTLKYDFFAPTLMQGQPAIAEVARIAARLG